MNRISRIFFAAVSGLIITPLWAQSTLNLGVVLNGTSWHGDNGSANSSFESDKGGQLGFSASLAIDAYYFGLSLQGGDYQFDTTGPTQFASGAATSTQNVTVTHSDFDLLAGYYFWDQVSLFVDLKSVSSKWDNNDYDQSFSGLGLGVAGFHPVNADWTLFGSLGFVGGDIREEGNSKLGTARSSALILGANYALGKTDTINMGFKLRSYLFDYDDGNEQQYNLNGVFFGYNHVFEF